jgi:SagB-type dehydrogenase family enzyme
MPRRDARPERFRRSPHLVSYWKAGQFYVHNYATGVAWSVPPGTVELLRHFDDWRSLGEFAASVGQQPSKLARVVGFMARATFLESSGNRRSPRESALEKWQSWNPVAGFFHRSTRDVRFVDPIEGNRQLRRKARGGQPPPPRVKRYRGAPVCRLPRVAASSEFPRVLLSRRTWRQFSRERLSLDALAALLGLTGGIHEWASLRGQGDFPLKTSPSGGARHPIELYVWARRVNGLERGLYHYAPDRHQLERLVSHRRAVSVKRYLPNQFWYERSAAIVFFSAVFERYLWKYTYARAYRAVLIEAGHQCQTFCLTASWLGLAPFCSMALADSRIEGDLGLDGVSEAVLYAAGVGVKPAGDAVHSKPAGFPPLRVRPNHRVVKR